MSVPEIIVNINCEDLDCDSCPDLEVCETLTYMHEEGKVTLFCNGQEPPMRYMYAYL